MDITKKSRDEPKTGRKLKPTPRAGKNWTPEEEAYLQDKWGTLSVSTIAKSLGRSIDAVVVRSQRLGLGSHLASDVRISVNQLMLALYQADTGSTGYTMHKLIREGLPVKTHKVKTKSFRVIDIDEFWKWAEDHKEFLDFSKFEEYSLGKEPDWAKVKRKADFQKLQQQGEHNEVWTGATDQKLKRMLSQHKYTYRDLSKELNRSEGAIKRRILDLGLKERPVRNKTRMWTEEEVETLCEMAEKGYDWGQIADKLGRTALATRGKYERLLNPSYMQRYYRGSVPMDYQGIHGIKPSEVLARHKVMQDVQFTEAPPDDNYNRTKVNKQHREKVVI